MWPSWLVYFLVFPDSFEGITKFFLRLDPEAEEEKETGCRSCWKSFELGVIAPVFTR